MLFKTVFRLGFLCLCIINIQEVRGQIKGRIMNDSVPVEGIHVLNLNNDLGAVTNENGEFEIETSLNDTLFFSGVKYLPKKIVIEEMISIQKNMTVELEEFTNELNEVFLDNKNVLLVSLGGKDTSDTIELSSIALDFTFVPLNEPYEMTVDEILASSNDDISLFKGGGGANLIELVGILLSPLAKIGKTRRSEKKTSKKRKKNHEKEVSEALDKIRPDFGDKFFIGILKLPEAHIDLFIKHCVSKGIAELYVRNDKFGIMEVFLEEIKGYKTLHNLK